MTVGARTPCPSDPTENFGGANEDSMTSPIATFSRYLNIHILNDIANYCVGWTKSVKNYLWPSEDRLGFAEDNILRCLRHNYYRYYVHVDDCCDIWTLSTLPHPHAGEERVYQKPPVVFLHGFIAGLGFWAMNLDDVVDIGYDVFAIDIPGYARSSRIYFSENGDETEKIFIEKIELWRQKMLIDKMVVVGHSFGGYIASAYCLAYPEHVSHIILVDPWGFPDIREDVTAVVEIADGTALSPLFGYPLWMRVVLMVLMPFSPFSFIRMGGRILGPRVIHFLRPDMTRRYARIFGDDDCSTVSNYIFQINNLLPTGEEAFRSLAMPLAWAKNPMIKRIGQVPREVPISFLYGSRSWIDYSTGFEVKSILKDSHVNVFIVDHAGHHVFADQPDSFNEIVRQILIGEETDNPYEHSLPTSSVRIKDMSMM